MEKVKSSKEMIKKFFILFYKVVLPIVMTLLLLGISSIVKRPVFMGSKLIDTLTRIFLCFWFCIGYIRLPTLRESYRFYPNILWKKSDISLKGRFYYSFLALLFGLGVMLVSYWMFKTFIPNLNGIILFLAILNGFIFAIPLLIQYEIFKI